MIILRSTPYIIITGYECSLFPFGDLVLDPNSSSLRNSDGPSLGSEPTKRIELYTGITQLSRIKIREGKKQTTKWKKIEKQKEKEKKMQDPYSMPNSFYLLSFVV